MIRAELLVSFPGNLYEPAKLMCTFDSIEPVHVLTVSALAHVSQQGVWHAFMLSCHVVILVDWKNSIQDRCVASVSKSPRFSHCHLCT